MSFVNEDDVMEIQEGFLQRVFKEVLDVDVKTPFLRMPWREAMDRFGSDKPDLRIDLEVQDITSVGQTAASVPSAAAQRSRPWRWTISPSSPGAQSCISGVTTRVCTFSTGRPAEAGRSACSSGVSTVASGPSSLWP